ncbi:hypothetical protein CPAR01_11050 [Colletotrichum paranaense]|uniref:Secreted protein n=3 Tax=Colletotrichum acutatum species complex TaxID=2707335 RepID=A0AAI9UXZ4_9PEZI|nr:uncharacterized protein CPAR01_11050 [Colletotrichum paranaense]KAK0371451.1 hypothetical protein CLIM01_11192 [Colletotrichum limetticola]KAK1465769.1 hypothetical protein CMEL01_11761 [Colletotrichum melonis]KAK1531401.1 hypothetical protein CPAR01_11050 [Colletotrichum paranaense]
MRWDGLGVLVWTCLDASLDQVGYGLAPRGCYYRLAVSCSTQVNERPLRSTILFGDRRTMYQVAVLSHYLEVS